MKDKLKKIHEHYRENYYSEEIADRIKDGVQQNIKNADKIQPGKKQRLNIAKKLLYVTAACIVLFGLFIGSAFISPVMAEVASKIPFLNKIFEQEPIYKNLLEELRDKGYDIGAGGYSVRDKTYFVEVRGSEEYYNQVREEVKEITKDIISSRGYNDFTVEVDKEKIMESDSDPANDPKYRESELVFDVLNEVVPRLQQKGYKIEPNYSVGYTGPDAKDITVDLDIEDTEKRTDEIEGAIHEGIKKQNIEKEVTIQFHPFNVQEREIENKWTTDVLPVIWEGMLSRKEYKTKGVGYSYKKGTMNIFITTTIDKSDNEAPEIAKKIEIAIHEFLQSDDLKDIVDDTPYKVVVRDKDSKDIN